MRVSKLRVQRLPLQLLRLEFYKKRLTSQASNELGPYNFAFSTSNVRNSTPSVL